MEKGNARGWEGKKVKTEASIRRAWLRRSEEQARDSSVGDGTLRGRRGALDLTMFLRTRMWVVC